MAVRGHQATEHCIAELPSMDSEVQTSGGKPLEKAHADQEGLFTAQRYKHSAGYTIRCRKISVHLLSTCQIGWGPAKLRDSIRFRIVRPIRDSIRTDGPIRNFRIVRAVNRHS